jgi:hypothetical protein
MEEEKILELEIIEKVQRVQCKEDEEDKCVWSRNGSLVKEAYSSIVKGYVAEDSSELAAVQLHLQSMFSKFSGLFGNKDYIGGNLDIGKIRKGSIITVLAGLLMYGVN